MNRLRQLWREVLEDGIGRPHPNPPGVKDITWRDYRIGIKRAMQDYQDDFRQMMGWKLKFPREDLTSKTDHDLQEIGRLLKETGESGAPVAKNFVQQQAEIIRLSINQFSKGYKEGRLGIDEPAQRSSSPATEDPKPSSKKSERPS
eukprot:Clim_evm70s22 gene=Clim_evmTU70s22